MAPSLLGLNSCVMVQSKDAKEVKDKVNQACLIAARSSAELGKLHASQGQPCFGQGAPVLTLRYLLDTRLALSVCHAWNMCLTMNVFLPPGNPSTGLSVT